MKLDYRFQYWALFWVSLVVLFLTLALNQYTRTFMVESNNLVLHSYRVVTLLGRLEASVIKCRLQKFGNPQQNEVLSQQKAELRQLVSDNVGQLQRLRRLDQALLQEATDRAPASVAQVDGLIGELVRSENQLLLVHSLQSQEDNDQRVVVLRTSTAIVLLLFPLAWSLVGRELGQRRRAEQGLLASEKLHRELYQSAPCGYHSLDRLGCYEEVNQTELDWVGYERQEMLGRAFADFLPPADQAQFLSAFEQLQARGQIHELELDFRHRQGHPLPLSLNATAVYDHQGQFAGARVLLTELGQRKLMEQELRTARDQAVSLAETKSEFLATMSHEIRTPLSGILGMAQLLHTTPLNALQRDFLDVISRSSENLLAVVNDVLDYSKIEAERLELLEDWIDPQELLESSFASVAFLAAQKGLDLCFCLQPECDQPFLGDSGRLRQVLINLIGNAVKFTSIGQVWVNLSGQAEQLSFEVRDTGCGISADQLELLFQPYQQVDPSRQRLGGTGLGLSISRRLIGLMQGRIEVESQPGLGSCFRFLIPWRQNKVAKSLGPLQLPPGFNRILLLDDNHLCRKTLTGLLQSLGASVEARGDLPEDFEVVGFDLVILDPGLALEQDARIQTLTIPWLAWCGPQAIAGGYRGRLSKPIGSRSLVAQLREIFTTAASADPPPESLDGSLAQRYPLDILIVDDVPTNLLVLGQCLSGFGYSFRVAHSGREALKELEQRPCELLLLDLNMPGMDGYQLMQRLKEGGQVPYVVAVTANSLAAERQRCLDLGMRDFLLKPFRIDHLKAVLLRVEVNPLDAAVLDYFLQVDPSGDFRLEVIASGVTDLEQLRLQLEEALRQQQRQQVEKLAHAMKGVANSLGARQLAPLLLQWEQSAHQGNLEGLNWDQLCQCWERTRQALEATPHIPLL